MASKVTARPGDEVARALVGLDEYTVLDAEEDLEGVLRVSVIRSRSEAACPGCGVFSARVKSYRSSTVIDAPAQGRPCRLVVTKRAFRCDTHWCERGSFTETTGEVPARARLTTRCRDAIGRAGRDRSTAGVAGEYGVSWPTAWAAIKAAAHKAIKARPRRCGTRLGIDETRFWWKVPWLTGIVDLDTGDLLDIVEGRTGATVTAWLDGLDAIERDLVAVVVTDPHAGYRRAVADGLPQATQVVDRFHVAMLAG